MTALHRLVAPARRFGGLLTVMALVAAGIVAFGTSQAEAGPAPVMYGYVPLPANDMQLALETINSGASPTLRYTVGVTNAAAGSVMYYDQWEDGYEADIANPTQSTTLVFGDTNTGNGDAATYCGANCAGDTLPQGAALIMQNDIPTPRNSANQLFDGGDKIASTRGFAITAGGYTTPTGSVLATVVSAYDTSKYADDYTAPVGTDTAVPSGTSDAFNYSGLLIQAAQDNTVVTVDKNRDGTADVTQTINEGKTLLVNGGVLQGATVHASAPVMVHEITGDTTASYESRTYNLFPDKVLWSDYMSPAGSSVSNFRTVNFLYNPTAAAITVTPTCASCAGTVALGAHSGASFTSPLGEAVRFTSSGGETFAAVAGVGSQSGALPGGGADASSSWDWGYTLIPTTQLTTQVVLGWAPGNSNVPPVSPSGDRDDNPVWFTTLADTTLHVDFDGDASTGAITGNDCFGAKHDTDITVSALASTRIFDNTDGDMTGARIYTCDGTAIAGAWGEDPQNAPTGAPGFDAGYTLIPTTTMLVHKSAVVANDSNGDGKTGPGDTLTYKINIADAGSLAFTSVKATDVLPAGLTYVAGSTVFDDGANVTALPDDSAPPAASVFPLDEAGAQIPNIGAGKTVEVRFDAVVDNPFPGNGATIGNSVCVAAAEATACDTSITPLANADLSLTKSVLTPAAHVGDDVTFRLTVANAGPDAAPAVAVTDQLPAGLSFVSASGTGSYNASTGVWSAGTVANGGTATLDVTATITVPAATNSAQITAAGAVDPDSTPGNSVVTEDDSASAATTATPAADLELTQVVAHTPAFLGDTALFAMTVTNNGPSPSTGSTVLVPLPAGVSPTTLLTPLGTSYLTGTWTIGTLNPGESKTLTFGGNLLTTNQVTSIGEIVTANEFDPDSTPGNHSASEDDWASNNVSAGGATIGDRIWEDGNANGQQDTGEAGVNGTPVALWQDADTNGSYETQVATTTASGNGNYTFPRLFPGAYRVVVGALPTGMVCTTCSATHDFVVTGAETIDTADYGYRFEADLSVSDVVVDAPAHVGDTGSFEITVTNHGPATSNVATIHHHLTSGGNIVDVTASQGTFDPQTGDWSSDSLAPGASADLTVTYLAESAGAITSSAEITNAILPDPDSTPNNHDGSEDDQDSAAVSPAGVIDLSLTQSVNKPVANVGDAVTFTLTLGNQGPSAATNVIVADLVPSGLTLTSAVPSQGACAVAVCTLGTIAPGGSATVLVHAVVAHAGAIENLAQVVGATEHDVDSQPQEDALDATHAPNQDDESSASVSGRQIDLSVTHTVSKPSVPVGTTVAWTIKVHNAGPSDATGVNLSDVLPAGLTYLDASADTGTFDHAHATWVVGALAHGDDATLTIHTKVTKAGPLTNTAQVSAANEADVDSTPANSVASEDDQAAATVTGTLVGDAPGTLWIDSNHNGAIDSGEPTLGNVRVQLVDAAGDVVAATMTDAAGHYHFDGLAPGVYSILVDATTLPQTITGQSFDPDGILDGRHTITVSALGDAVTNFGYVVAAPATPASDSLPRTGGDAPLGPVGGLLGLVLVLRRRARR